MVDLVRENTGSEWGPIAAGDGRGGRFDTDRPFADIGRRNLTDGWKFELVRVRKSILLDKGRVDDAGTGANG